MNSAIRSVATVMVGACALLLGSVAASAQTTVDVENSYSNVGAIMVWRVDDSGKPVQLLAFASGTLIRSRVMVTAGHFTAPAKALGGMPPTIRDVRELQSDGCTGSRHMDSGDSSGHAPIDAALPAAAWMRSDRRNPGRSARTWHCRRWTRIPRTCAGQHQASRARGAGHARQIRRSSHNDRGIRHHVTSDQGCRGRRMAMGRQAAYQGLGRAEDRR